MIISIWYKSVTFTNCHLHWGLLSAHLCKLYAKKVLQVKAANLIVNYAKKNRSNYLMHGTHGWFHATQHALNNFTFSRSKVTHELHYTVFHKSTIHVVWCPWMCKWTSPWSIASGQVDETDCNITASHSLIPSQLLDLNHFCIRTRGCEYVSTLLPALSCMYSSNTCGSLKGAQLECASLLPCAEFHHSLGIGWALNVNMLHLQFPLSDIKTAQRKAICTKRWKHMKKGRQQIVMHKWIRKIQLEKWKEW